MLTPDIERAHALVEVAALLKKADIIRERHLRDMNLHAQGWVEGSPGVIATVRLESLCDGLKLERAGQ